MADDSDDESSGRGFKPMDVMGPAVIFNVGTSNTINSTVLKELRNKLHNPDVCAECSTRHGQGGGALLQCSSCQDRKYCSVECQKKHWKLHKKLCQAGKLDLLSV